MAKDTITLALNGEIPFQYFADAISHLNNLVEALSSEMGVADDIDWLVHDLQVSSAIATMRGETKSIEKVEGVVSAYGQLGKDLEIGRRPQFSVPVVREAYAITKILNGRISSVRFETADMDAIVTSPPGVPTEPSTKITYGAVEGRVQTLTERKGLRFTLYDTLRDRAVSCYLQEGQEELMRQSWGRMAIVEGKISRDKENGRPLAIRRIVSVRVLSETQSGSYLKARGVAPRKPESPQLRDA
jgi:hypothetical protein